MAVCYMCLKIENYCLKFFVKIGIGENTCPEVFGLCF